jgi:hypothetical protein
VRVGETKGNQCRLVDSTADKDSKTADLGDEIALMSGKRKRKHAKRKDWNEEG